MNSCRHSHEDDNGEQLLIQHAHRQANGGQNDFSRAAGVHGEAYRQCFLMIQTTASRLPR